jgi:predicted anti-sigma-YlaC factor YlaD
MIFKPHCRDELTMYLDGQFPPEAHARVAAHLAQCRRCRSELEQVAMARAVLQRLPVVKAPEALWKSIEAASDARRRQKSRPAAAWRYAFAVLSLVLAVGGYLMLRSRPESRWELVRLNGSPTVGGRQIPARKTIRTGYWVETDGTSRARIRVGDIGSVDVEPNTRVRLVSTGASGHRLALASGKIKAAISAPPRLFFVDTPGGTAVDLGCEYDLHCNRSGEGVLNVRTGWVALEWNGRDSLVPAGASCRMWPGAGPGTPRFDDAPARLAQALDVIDATAERREALGIVLAEARVRDTLSLWHLLSRVDSADRLRVYERTAALAPPPAGVERKRILQLDKDSLTRWKDELAWMW